MADASDRAAEAVCEAANPAGNRTWWITAAVLWALVLGWAYLPIPNAWVEFLYARGVYPVVSRLALALTSPIPFSLATVGVALIVFGFPILWYLRARRGIRREGWNRWQGLFWGLRMLAVLVPGLIVWTLVLWVAGYRRLPMEERLDFDVAPIEAAERRQWLDAAFVLIQDHAQADGDRDPEAAVAAVADAMRAVLYDWENRIIALPDGVKRTIPGLLLRNGTSGMAVPLTLEPHVDGGLPDAAFVWTAAHELGHVAGANPEDEASLLGWAAGFRADHPFARYATALDLYTDIARRLPPEAREAAYDALPEIAHEDLRRLREASARYRIDWYRNWSWRTYDRFLRAQGVQGGVASYSRAVTLFFAAWRSGYVRLPEATG